jgi:hypothetical protein
LRSSFLAVVEKRRDLVEAGRVIEKLPCGFEDRRADMDLCEVLVACHLETLSG